MTVVEAEVWVQYWIGYYEGRCNKTNWSKWVRLSDENRDYINKVLKHYGY